MKLSQYDISWSISKKKENHILEEFDKYKLKNGGKCLQCTSVYIA